MLSLIPQRCQAQPTAEIGLERSWEALAELPCPLLQNFLSRHVIVLYCLTQYLLFLSSSLLTTVVVEYNDVLIHVYNVRDKIRLIEKVVFVAKTSKTCSLEACNALSSSSPFIRRSAPVWNRVHCNQQLPFPSHPGLSGNHHSPLYFRAQLP